MAFRLLSLARSTQAGVRLASTAAFPKHVLSSKQFDRDTIESVLDTAGRFRNALKTSDRLDILRGKIAALIFMEPSTRTASSFNAAMLRLGGSVIPINEETSSAKKGETLEDTVRVMQNYVDAIVIRHKIQGSVAKAADVASVPVLNAGDGPGEHPTQGLLDMFCMQSELGKLDGLTITMVGDLKYGRTVHSLSRLLSHFNIRVNYIAPPELAMPDYLVKELQSKKSYEQHVGTDLMKVLPETDVLYMTRIQQERFTDQAQYQKLKGSYILNPQVMQSCKKKMIVMHPLPRVDEITPEVDSDPRAAYFREVGYGMHTRMALLAKVLGKA